jgi:hypothetical protein
MNVTVYGPDGITLLEQIVDNGDGTGVYTAFSTDGTIEATETLTDLPIEEPPALDPLHQLAQAIVDATTLDDVKATAVAILTDGDS